MLDSLVELMPFSSTPTSVVSPITLLQSLNYQPSLRQHCFEKSKIHHFTA